jgi:hypothetical protein
MPDQAERKLMVMHTSIPGMRQGTLDSTHWVHIITP